MKKAKFLPLFLLSMFVVSNVIFAQTPGVRWTKYIANPYFDYELIYDIKLTSDNGFILAGADSASWQFSEAAVLQRSMGGFPWLVKTDSAGNIVWKKRHSGNAGVSSVFSSVVQARDGGFVAVGSLWKCCPADTVFLIAKYSAAGNLLWEKQYGGTRGDGAFSISNTGTNGFIVAGYAKSTDGDVVGNNGAAGKSDVWLLRIDDNGNIIWKKCFGGTGDEIGESVVQANDYGFVVAGSATSANGNLTNNIGGNDGWVFKTDSSGNFLWQRNAGSFSNDAFRKVIVGSDNHIYLAGVADSTSQIINGLKPLKNLWVMKLTASGLPVWSRAYGGNDYTNEGAYDIKQSFDNSLLVTGYTYSNNGDVTFNNGGSDAWLLRLSDAGNLLWQKTIGTPRNEYGFSTAFLSEYDFIVAGVADSVSNSSTDGFIAKLGNSNIIRGVLFFDANSNGIRDAGEVNFNNASVKTQKGTEIITVQPNNGRFQFDVDLGSYTTTAQTFNPYYTVVPPSRNSTFATYFNVDSFAFALQPIPNQQDLIVHLIPTTPARPGFKSYYALNYKNIGTTTIANGTVKLIKDSRTSFSLSLPVPTSIVADTITWAYTNLKPLDSISIGIEMNVAAPPTVNINDTLKFTAIVLPVVGDLTPANDTARVRQRVQGSYDPNDKQESYAGRMPVKDVANGSYINYIIRFQNTGNDTAFFVRLLDTLDAKLDWNSFQMIGSSHAYNLTIKNGNKLNWFFDNIKLPDSTTNLLRSNGYVAFRIKPKNTLVANDIIANKASIYFDYNLPVVTNTTLTTVVPDVTTGIRDVQNTDMKLIVAPNPNAGQSVLQISGKLVGKFELKMIDNSGRIIMNQTLNRNNVFETLQVPMDLQQLPAGVYYIQLQQKEKLWWQKVVLQ